MNLLTRRYFLEDVLPRLAGPPPPPKPVDVHAADPQAPTDPGEVMELLGCGREQAARADLERELSGTKAAAERLAELLAAVTAPSTTLLGPTCWADLRDRPIRLLRSSKGTSTTRCLVARLTICWHF